MKKMTAILAVRIDRELKDEFERAVEKKRLRVSDLVRMWVVEFVEGERNVRRS